jgi:hypothetical protein
MSHVVELLRPLEDYFAFTELERHGSARRFTITLPYLSDQQLGRLQWWWRMSDSEAALLGDAGMAARRTREIERFCRHIKSWLTNTGQRLHGEGPIPVLDTTAIGERPVRRTRRGVRHPGTHTHLARSR